MTRNRWRIAFFALAVVLIAVVSVAAGLAATLGTGQANKGAKKLSTVWGFNFKTFESTPQTVATTNVTIPSRQSGIFLIRFFSNSECNFGGAGSECDVEVHVDGNLLVRVEFDADDTGDNYREAHALEWSTRVLESGPHTVEIKAYVLNFGGSGTRILLDEWHLAVEYWRVT